MPITPSRIANDPQAPLAWNTSLAVVALEKLRRAKEIRTSEERALKVVADQLDLLQKASQIRVNFDEDSIEQEAEALPLNLQDSFFTLVAISDKNSSIGKPPTLEKTGADLHYIIEQLHSEGAAGLDPTMLRNAQEVCIELLEHINRQRPNTSIR